MAFIDLGKLKFNWQGDWQAATNYEVDDVVFYNNHSYVCIVTHSATAVVPSANLTQWSLMSAGVHFREDGDWSGSSTYYLYDVVRYNSSLYVLTGENSSTNDTPGSTPWSLFQSAPAGNVMNSIGAMEVRNNENATVELTVNPTVNKGLTVQEAPRETYVSRAFNYEEDGDYGKSMNTPGSIPAETYTQTVTAQRNGATYSSGSYIITGSDRFGPINKKHDPNITINVGDTIVFNNGTGAHPIDIRDQSNTQVTTGTLTGAGTTGTVTWVTTGVTAGVYYYQCTAHTGMVGSITVRDVSYPRGSSTSNGTIDVCRGKSYTITFANNLTNGQTYDLYTTAGGHSVATESVTDTEGNSAYTSNTNSGVAWTTGNTVTITFAPNETTPDTVYIGQRGGASITSNLIINVHDLAYVPSWGTAAPSVSTASGNDQREFKYWQDWYGGDTYDNPASPTWGELLPQSTRDPGADVKVGGNAVGAQSRRLYRGSGGTSNTVQWTVPDGVEKIRVTTIGGGGGGGCFTSHYYGGCGGGGGAFASGEYNVTEGEVLTITVGHGGAGTWGGTAPSGGTTTVLSNSGTNILVQAEGGSGGYYMQQNGVGGDAITVGGNNIVSGTAITGAGGNGGWGTWGAWPSGPEGYCSGGGGAAGSMFGNGFSGGSSRSYIVGYEYSSCGGGGIGGVGGVGSGNYTSNTTYPVSGGGGGGSAGPGGNGISSGNSSGTDSTNRYSGGQGGAGLSDQIHIQGYIDHMPDVRGDGHHGQEVFNNYLSGSPSNYQLIRHNNHSAKEGGRFGDGEAPYPQAGWITNHWTRNSMGNAQNGGFQRIQQATWMGRTQAAAIDFPTKAFNGILGRLWGGGGGGGGGTGNNAYYSSRGGDGGSGAGGGGGQQYTTSHGISPATHGTANIQREWSVWDPANMAWRMHDNFRYGDSVQGLVNPSTYSSITPHYSGTGGHGGALGGGGGGCCYGMQGGWGGIGGGGGGASSSHSPHYYSQGGNGGVGYVLIEW